MTSNVLRLTKMLLISKDDKCRGCDSVGLAAMDEDADDGGDVQRAPTPFSFSMLVSFFGRIESERVTVAL